MMKLAHFNVEVSMIFSCILISIGRRCTEMVFLSLERIAEPVNPNYTFFFDLKKHIAIFNS